jgi:hypothetical protein
VTAIVGIEHEGHVWMGGDAAVTWPNHARIEATSAKVWKSGEWVIGTCGSVRLGLLLRHALTLPQPPDDEDDLERFLTMEFTDAVRGVLLESGTVHSKNNVEGMDGSEFLFGVRGELWLMQEDFGIIRSAERYAATGCGIDLCLGSLYSSGVRSPKKRITEALEAAAKHNAAVASPFTILKA